MLRPADPAAAGTAAPALAAERRWTVATPASADAKQALLRDVSSLVARTRFAALYQDLEWHFSGPDDWGAALVCVRAGDAGVDGYAPFFVQDRPLRVLAGEVTVASFALQRYTLFGEPLLAPGDEPVATQATLDLLRMARTRLGPTDGLFFEGIATDSLAYRVITTHPDAARDFIVLPTCEPYEHQYIEMPPTYDAYLASLGSRSRGSLRNSERKLEREMDNRVRTDCFESAADAERFLRDGEAISRTTYQWNLLGLGLRVTESLRRKVLFAAQRGWLRSYILYCKDVPVAFIFGYQYLGCYYIVDGGYNPDYANLSVGSVLQLKIFQDLYARGPVPALFDFATGYGTHKARYGNLSRTEAEVLLLPRTLRNRWRVGVFRVGTRVATAAIRLVERLGLKAALKKAIRRLSTR